MRWLTGFLDLPADRFDAAATFWAAVTGSTRSAPRGEHGEFSTLLPPNGDPWLRLQRVLGGPGGAHLDLHVDDLAAGADRAVALGATRVFAADDLIVLGSPAGAAFCLVPHENEVRRSTPIRWPGGQRSITDQLCLDIPPSRYDTECRFWSELTGWAIEDTDSREFRALARPADMPMRLLLQRLDAEPLSGIAAAHVDLACDDAAAEARRHESLGATRLAEFRDWILLVYPAALRYCVTRRHPDTGRRR